MDDVVLKVENLDKVYRLGEIGTGTISHDLNRWWSKIRGKEDPFKKVGEVNDRAQKGENGEYVKVLNNIHFEVQRGEVLGVIGKNGAGKSTLLKVISQITSPSSGIVKAKGRISSLLEVGTGMHPEMTGKENVYLNGTILGMTRMEIDTKFDEIMEFAGCSRYADTPVKRYSSGMKVRLGFAVAAFLEPEILIVDEVLAVGDAEFQKKAIGKIKDISKGRGRTVIFVSHNMGSISNICKRCIVLDKGQIIFDGVTEEAIKKYISSSVSKSSYENDSDNGKNVIKKLTVGSVLDEAKDEILFKDKIKINWQIKVKETKGMVLSFHLKSINETVVLADILELDLLEKVSKGDSIEYLLPEEFLMPGDYILNSALHIPNNIVFDSVIDQIGFKIVDTGTNLSRINKLNSIIKSPGSWVNVS